ncbi:MAG: DEAD/DEAH box helicase family protein [Spirochaetales bacterium]|nr:DEAD/DEAH box helicase family protein [Spirochaetales bacterium]
MEFRFKIQQYQSDAVDAVISVFEGQPYIDGLSYMRDLGKDLTLFSQDEAIGYSNAKIALSDGELLANINRIQQGSNIPVSSELSKSIGGCSIDVEMETGTGKTYVYIKTMFELNKKYGWSKFIVVVPSIAIREGVKKSFDMTVDHFMEYYHKKARYFVYDSSNLTLLETFSSSADLSVMIINTQAFASSLKEGANNQFARKIYSERDEFGSRRPIDVIKANNPILILDEPQKMGGAVTVKALREQFNPLFSLNYSATHKERHNPVYVLDALDAYNQRLVKKIEVKGFEVKNLAGTNGYLFLHGIILSPKDPPKARLEFEVRQVNGIKRITKCLSEGESIYAESGNMNQYQNGYFINGIDPYDNSITLQNGIVLHSGEAVGDVSEDDIRRIQIRETIISHFDKEEELFNKGIKTLSLFFIDQVDHYRKYDEEGNEQLGDYGKIFEEEYLAELNERLSLFEDTPYQKYLRTYCSDVHAVHNGYFSIDKKGRCVNSEVKRGAEFSDDITAYDLILKNKERLLSFEEPTRFIFSHSALREGWDNPNIFQICTLKHSDNQLAQRQEVGRGLRICVDKDGNRMDKELLGSSVFDINKLTVVASDSYASFVNSLQSEMEKDLAERPRKADIEFFTNKTVSTVDGKQKTLTKVDATAVYFYLVQNGYINVEGNVTEKFKTDTANNTVAKMEGEIEKYQKDIITLVKSVFDPSVMKKMIDDGRKTPVKDNPLTPNFYKKEFMELWNSINDKYAYRVEFESDELIKKSVEHLNGNLQVKRLQYVVSVGSQKDSISYDEAKNKDSFSITNTRNKSLKSATSKAKYDLVGDIAKKTTLTRRTVVAILKQLSFEKFEMFKLNPEDFILQVSKAINQQKATMVVDHISYYKTGEKYDSSIFTAVKTDRDFVKAFVGEKSVQKYIFPDGLSENSTEKKFAESLEKADEVKIYAKLPRGFQIPTPVGNYAPDWAIVFNEGMVKHIYFVAETKGSMDSMSLDTFEDTKIKCTKHLFNNLTDVDVKFDFINNFQNLMNIVMK